MDDNLAFSLALDLLFNGQNMDYCERPISLSAMETIPAFMELKEGSKVCVIGPGGGRLVRTLFDKGHYVDAFEGRHECLAHLRELFENFPKVKVYNVSMLEDPLKRGELRYDAIFCMDDLRAFREEKNWTKSVDQMVRDYGYFVYSQVSNQLPTSENTLQKYFKLVGDYNVSEQTAAEIRECYLGLDYWRPREGDLKMVKEALQLVESASNLRRSIMSGVEVRYVAWRKKDRMGR